MTNDTSAPAEQEHLSDPELIALVRSGDATAYEVLFRRHHEVARRFALRLAGAERSEDIVSESFAKILDLLHRGKGPDVAFRAYLLTTVRTVHLNFIRAGRKESPVADSELQGLTDPVDLDVDSRFDSGAIARAFKQLPERWQSALWMTAVEGIPNEEVSKQLGIHTNAVASLAFRARAGLRQAYLAEHLRETADAECCRVIDLLPSFLRGNLTSRRRQLVESHLERCSRCTVAATELADVDRRLGALLAPIVVGGAAAALWPATASAPAAPVASGVLAGIAKSSTGVTLLGGVGTGLGAAKVAAAATLAAASIGMSVHAVTSGTDETPASSPEAPPSSLVLPPSAESDADGPASPELFTPAPTASLSGLPAPSSGTPESGPTSQVTASPLPGHSSTASPTSAPSPHPTGTPVPMQSRSMSIEQMETATFTRSGMTWNRVTVVVSEPAPDTRLVLRTNRTYQARVRSAAGSGWTCKKPRVDWAVPNGPRSSTSCVHDGSGADAPLVLEYRVDSRCKLTGSLTPPTGILDPDLSDNSVTIALVD